MLQLWKKPSLILPQPCRADTIDANALSSAYGDIRSIHAGNAFWSAVPNALRDVVYMEVNKPFETTDEDVEGLTALVDGPIRRQ